MNKEKKKFKKMIEQIIADTNNQEVFKDDEQVFICTFAERTKDMIRTKQLAQDIVLHGGINNGLRYSDKYDFISAFLERKNKRKEWAKNFLILGGILLALAILLLFAHHFEWMSMKVIKSIIIFVVTWLLALVSFIISIKLWYTDYLKFLFVGLALSIFIIGSVISIQTLKSLEWDTFITVDGDSYNGNEVVQKTDGYYSLDSDGNLIKLDISKIVKGK